jgi:hypothetical protein
MSSGKRQFPYYSKVEGFELQRRRLEDDPSRCAATPGCCCRYGAAGGTGFRLSSRSPSRSMPLLHVSRDRDGPKVWQAREQTSFDEYDAITVCARGGAAAGLHSPAPHSAHLGAAACRHGSTAALAAEWVARCPATAGRRL